VAEKAAPVNRAHLALVLDHLPAVVDERMYLTFQRLGLTRPAVKAAINHLVHQGEARLEVGAGGTNLLPADPPAKTTRAKKE
jgi:hypothetical protein